MSPFTVVVLCIQICLIQTVFSQTCGCSSSRVYSGYSGSSSITSAGSSSACAFGGTGQGTVGAVGTVGASGNTCVTGQVPVLGEVTFSGCADATGSVTITGQCGCGCG